jgi:hypothetical protein
MFRLLAPMSLFFLINCSTQTKNEIQFEEWAQIIQKEIQLSSQKLVQCTSWLELKTNEQIKVTAFVKIHPTGKLETLVLSDSQRWGKTFYECAFNLMDEYQYTSYSGETSIEVEQPFIFEKKEGSN